MGVLVPGVGTMHVYEPQTILKKAISGLKRKASLIVDSVQTAQWYPVTYEYVWPPELTINEHTTCVCAHTAGTYDNITLKTLDMSVSGQPAHPHWTLSITTSLQTVMGLPTSTIHRTYKTAINTHESTSPRIQYNSLIGCSGNTLLLRSCHQCTMHTPYKLS